MSTRRPARRLTGDEFEAAARRLRIQPANLQLARAVMVDGVPVTELAAAHGVAHQGVSRTVGRVYDAHLHAAELPRDWRSVTVTVPPEMADEITTMAVNAADALHRRKRVEAAMQFSRMREKANQAT